MISTKHILALEVLELLIQNTVMTTKAIEKALGRLQWATAVCPMTKSLLQPFWAWKMAVTSSGRPPKTVRLLALLLKELFTIPYRQLSPYLPKSSWWGCSDVSADSTGEAYIGGWLSDAQSPARDSVHWFHFKVSPEMFPWAFKEGNPQKRIAALELLGTLVLTHCILQKQGKTAAAVRIPVGSDNQGNVFCVTQFCIKEATHCSHFDGTRFASSCRWLLVSTLSCSSGTQSMGGRSHAPALWWLLIRALSRCE